MKTDFNTETTSGDDDDDDDDKNIKTKIKTYKDSIITNFYKKSGSKKIPEEKVPHKILLFMHMKSIIHKYFQKNANILKTKNYFDMELESESDSNSDSDNGIYIDIDKEE